jgi:hypothetical protein
LPAWGFRGANGLLVTAGKDALARFGECCQNGLRRKTGTRERGTYLLAETLKALLLWQKNQAVSQTQDSKGRTRTQAKVSTELFWDSELSLLTDLRCGQVFKGRLSARYNSAPGRNILPWAVRAGHQPCDCRDCLRVTD